jgi:tRNA-specific 2-thiouridylase
MSRVVLAMSGGVDSSVAAWLLRQAGHDVVGLFMRHGQKLPAACTTNDSKGRPINNSGTVPIIPPGKWDCPPPKPCRSEADADDARRVADRLGMTLHVVDFQPEFDRIVESFVEAYTAGRTPNPCIVCNTRLKFGKLFEYADNMGAEFMATGHYARLAAIGAGAEIALCRGRDASKDQSYMLFGIQRRLLRRLKFPLGEHHKDQIRRIAARLELHVAQKRESQDICFVPEGDHARFVRQYRGNIDASGEIVTTDGTVVGRHDGLEHFTIGQRKGLKIAFGEPRYVVRIEPQTRRVVVGTKAELARTELTAEGANWLIDEPAEPIRCQVKIRYRSRPVAATVHTLPNSRFQVQFDEPCHSIAPGQAAVCYQGDRLLGGGWIQ